MPVLFTHTHVAVFLVVMFIQCCVFVCCLITRYFLQIASRGQSSQIQPNDRLSAALLYGGLSCAMPSVHISVISETSLTPTTLYNQQIKSLSAGRSDVCVCDAADLKLTLP